jgi:BirA family transcriptional regulator, biotin operon repressor / biotin---[acetyl-CoA-carboxylase] ligase
LGFLIPMNIKSIQKFPISKIRYFDSIGSTNDEALAWAEQGAPDLSIVIADEQTAGRGRLDRKWFTPKGSALAFSLILRPDNNAHLSRTVGLAALSIADACARLGLSAQIKWPNDILLNGKKAAGILIETIWAGDKVTALVIGMGINVLKGSIPPAEQLKFPATSLETELGHPVERESFLQEILSRLMARRPQMDTDDFLTAWENHLAYKGENVQMINGGNEIMAGKLLGLWANGSLRLQDELGNQLTVHVGDVSLRPAA